MDNAFLPGLSAYADLTDDSSHLDHPEIPPTHGEFPGNTLGDLNGFATRAVRFGQLRGAEGEHGDPIYTTSSFVFSSAEEAKRRFVDDASGNIYSRFTNPTVRTFEQRLAALEEGQFATATGSGMAAILTLGLATLKAGDHVVASTGLFGSTTNLFKKMFGRFGVTTTFVELSDLEQWRSSIRPETRMLFLETPSNPLGEIADIAALAKLAKTHDARLVVDNCFCTPALQQPLLLGADVVVHSATKFLDGQGRCVGGAIVHSDETLRDELNALMRCAGPSLSPFNAWVFLKGLETLDLRMRAHCGNSLKVAQWLEQHPAVNKVYYPGLKSHPQHALAASQQSGFGGVVSFEVGSGRDDAWRVVDATSMLSITANLGDTKSTITHPATTTHGRVSEADRAKAGITENLLRVSVGLEEVDDIIADLARGLDQLLTSPVFIPGVNTSAAPREASVLMEAEELQQILTGSHPEIRDIQIIDLSSAELYDDEHIPGAINFDYANLVTGEKPAAGKLPPLDAIRERLEASGISSDRAMVVYDSEGTGKASRFCWTMDLLGFNDWSLLNGGIDAWDNDDRALSDEPVVTQPAVFNVTDNRDSYLATYEDVLRRMDNPDVGLLDARSVGEFTGKDIRAAHGGRIPGARNLDWLDTLDPANYCRLKQPEVLKTMLRDQGLTPDKEIIVYCQTHHRSSLSYVMLKWLGYENVRAYAGSWSEWGNQSDPPVETG